MEGFYTPWIVVSMEEKNLRSYPSHRKQKSSLLKKIVHFFFLFCNENVSHRMTEQWLNRKSKQFSSLSLKPLIAQNAPFISALNRWLRKENNNIQKKVKVLMAMVFKSGRPMAMRFFHTKMAIRQRDGSTMDSACAKFSTTSNCKLWTLGSWDSTSHHLQSLERLHIRTYTL